MANISSIQITSPTVPGYAVAGNDIVVRVNFSAPVTLTIPSGTGPYLALDLQSTGAAHAACQTEAGAGLNYLDFKYTVLENDFSYGDILLIKSIELNGSTIMDGATPAVLTGYTLTDEITVDAIPLFYSLSKVSPAYAKTGTVITFELCSNKSVSAPTATVGVTPATLASSDGLTHVFTYTIQAGDSEASTLDIVAGGADDAGNTASQTIALPVTVDRTASAAPSKPTNLNSIPSSGLVRFSWDAVTDTDVDDYEVLIKQGATTVASDTVQETYFSYTAASGVGGSSDEYTCTVRAIDRAGNPSEWSTLSDPVTVDTRVLKCVLTTAALTKLSTRSFTVTATFTDESDNPVAISLLKEAGVKIINGAHDGFTQVGTGVYSFIVTPSSVGPVVVSLDERTAYTITGAANSASNLLTLDFNNTRPSCTVTPRISGSTNTAPVLFDVEFSIPVTGLTTADFTLAGSASSSLSGAGSKYVLSITPSAGTRPTTVSASVKDSIAADEYGNTNTVSNTASVSFDDVRPTLQGVSCLESASTTYSAGTSIHLRAQFTPDKPVYVNFNLAKPALNILIGATERQAEYVAGSGTSALIFRYTVTPTDPTGAVTNGDLENSDSITDKAGNTLDNSVSTDFLTASGLSVDPDSTTMIDAAASISDDIASTELEQLVGSSLFTERELISGIGDGDDLKVTLDAVAGSTWTPNIHKGWFYYGDAEHYLFASKGVKTSASYTANTAVDLEIDDPLSLGPIFVSLTPHDTEVYSPAVQVQSNVCAAVSVSPESSIPNTNNSRATIPGYVMEAYRSNLKHQMRKVGSEDAVSNADEYYVGTDVTTGSLVHYIVFSGTDPIFVSYVGTGAPTDRWLQQNICLVDKYMNARAVYKNISDGYTPTVTILEDGVLTVLDASSYMDGNVFSLPSTYTKSDTTQGTISSGDRIVIKYYVEGSWVLEGTSVRCYHHQVGAQDLKIEFETSDAEYWDGGEMPPISRSYIQLNPLLSGVGSGFLYVVDSASEPPAPARVTLAAATGSAVVKSNGTGQPVRLRATILDKNNNPVQGSAIAFTGTCTQEITRGTGDTDSLPTYVKQSINGVNLTFSGAQYGSQSYALTTDFTVAWSTDHYVITWLGLNRPPAGVEYTATYSPAPGTTSLIQPESHLTDWEGNVSAVWSPAWPGVCSLTASSGAISSGAVRLSQYSYETLTADVFRDADMRMKVYLTITDLVGDPGTKLSRAYVSDITGAYPMAGVSVNFVADSGKFSGITTRPDGRIVTDDDGIATCSYYPSGEDIVYAEVTGADGTVYASSRLKLIGDE